VGCRRHLLSNGMDEDYTFGYSEDELRRAADID
jgi:hypothetical protein